MPGINDDGMFKGFMKVVGMALLISFFIAIFMSLVLMKESEIFSSWFIDVYKPSKGFVLEKAPIRIIFFGEAKGEANAENISKIIDALDKVEYQDYKFNPDVNINFSSSLKGAKERDAQKAVKVHLETDPTNGLIDGVLSPSSK
jgi:hypothetical protein